MSARSKILRLAVGNHLSFWCPGCDRAHGVGYGEGTGPRWGWNGSAEKPTFTPSVKVVGTEFTPKGRTDHRTWLAAGCPRPGPEFECLDTVCHSFITDGRIQFLSDCTHELAGQTVALPEWPISTDV